MTLLRETIMEMLVADVHVFANHNRFNYQDAELRNVIGYLLKRLQSRLLELGIKESVLNLEMKDTPDDNYELTHAMIARLVREPIFITEQQIVRNFSFDSRREHQTVYHPPFGIKPGPHAYQFAANGREPNVMFHVCGRMSSGKTMVIHELKLLLKALHPDIKIIECANQYDVPDKFDITADSIAYNEYIERMSNNIISIGSVPAHRVGRWNEMQSNVRF